MMPQDHCRAWRWLRSSYSSAELAPGDLPAEDTAAQLFVALSPIVVIDSRGGRASTITAGGRVKRRVKDKVRIYAVGEYCVSICGAQQSP